MYLVMFLLVSLVFYLAYQLIKIHVRVDRIEETLELEDDDEVLSEEHK